MGSFLAGCGGDPAGLHGSDPASLPSAGASIYGIEAIAGRKRVRFLPSDLESPDPESGASLRSQSVSVPDGNGTREVIPDQPAELAGSLLLLLAAGECGIYAEDAGMHAPFPDAATEVRFPWIEGNSWYVLGGKMNWGSGTSAFKSCDDVLFHEEALLCTASKLEEVASAVKPIVWDRVDRRPDWMGQDLEENSLVIPPQRQKNRFIVRDLALNVLAHLGRLDLEKPTTLAHTTCAQGYTNAIVNPTAGEAAALSLFGVAGGARPPYFKPHIGLQTDVNGQVILDGGGDPLPLTLPVNVGNVPKLAGARLEHQAKVLREAGVLLKRLIKDSVWADAAGAAELRAQAADPKLGNELYWGAKTPDGKLYPYNSMAHVARTLFGRLETGVAVQPPILQPDPLNAPLPYTDPRCSGYAKNEILVGSPYLALDPAVGVDWAARWEDLPINSAGQLRATRLLNNAGVVLSNASAHQPNLTATREALKEQLQLHAALVEGITDAASPEFAAFRISNTGIAVGQQLDDISDQDLRFGFDRTRNAFEQLTAQRAISTANLTAGLKPNHTAAGAISSLALVIQGGLPRGDVSTDIIARLGGAQAASQCAEWFDASIGVNAASAEAQKVAAFQSAFVLGDVFRNRLSAMRDLVDTSGIGAQTNAGKLAGIGAAELRTWAGPGRVYTKRVNYEGMRQAFTLQGFLPEDFGVKSPTDIAGRLAVVYGEPWVADCAAGIRVTCPDDFEASYVPDMEMVQVGSAIANFADYNGSDGRALEFVVPMGGVFNPPVVPFGSAGTKHIYLVARASATGTGRVLAAFKPSAEDFVSSEVVSDYQRDLANKLLGVDKGFATKGLRFKGIRLGESPGYCVENVPNDFFVPLENELTSDSDQFEDSWKHYLDLAAIASREADSLGQELIQRNLAADEKKQAGREALGQTCGDFAAIDKVGVGKGTIAPPDDDSALAACFHEDTIDIVFLTEDPFVGATDTEATCQIKDLLGCPRGAADAECGGFAGLAGPQVNPILPASELCELSELSHAGLGYGEWQDPRKGLLAAGGTTDLDCAPALALYQAAQNHQLDANKAMEVAIQPWASPEQLSAVLGRMRLSTDPDAASVKWDLTIAGELVLSTSKLRTSIVCT